MAGLVASSVGTILEYCIGTQHRISMSSMNAGSSLILRFFFSFLGISGIGSCVALKLIISFVLAW